MSLPDLTDIGMQMTSNALVLAAICAGSRVVIEHMVEKLKNADAGGAEDVVRYSAWGLWVAFVLSIISAIVGLFCAKWGAFFFIVASVSLLFSFLFAILYSSYIWLFAHTTLGP